jgi:hypothetical protein
MTADLYLILLVAVALVAREWLHRKQRKPR